ncbi:hypothetical protein C0J52_26346 [Blattella germanica]|nr:hypothetical protein C0J52_26346 [Blattella germanica]
MVKEYTCKMAEQNQVEEYNTEYIESFNQDEFTPNLDNISEHKELHEKYPLYSGAPISFWQGNINKMVGVTRSVDPLTPFKRNSAFTKPLDQVLDEPIRPL